MTIPTNQVLEIIWVVWLISWVAASFWSNRQQKRAAELETWTYRAAMIAGGILLAPFTGPLLGERPIWKLSSAGIVALTVLMLAGLALTWWARIYLGPLWSSVISRKPDHKIIDTGPYAFVRHPIYTGYLLTHAGFLLAHPQFANLALVVVSDIALIIRALHEERALQRDQRYREYTASVRWRLVPGLI